MKPIRKITQIIKLLVFSALFFTCLMACVEEESYKEKPKSLGNTAWIHPYTADISAALFYYFTPAKYLLRNEYSEAVPVVVKNPATGKPIIVKYPVEIIDPVTGEKTTVFFERDSIVFKNQLVVDTIDLGTYNYNSNAGTFTLFSEVYKEKEDEEKPLELEGYFSDGFIFVDDNVGGSYQRIK